MAAPEGGRGRILRLQRYSLQDGPGLRTTVFLKGCPLACTWCHNPESQSPEPEMIMRESRCIGCGACEKVCPVQDQPAVYVTNVGESRSPSNKILLEDTNYNRT